jgi:pimeloyl-ACP methyl ester carboxylesterase
MWQKSRLTVALGVNGLLARCCSFEFVKRVASFGFATLLLFDHTARAADSGGLPATLLASVRKADAAYRSLPTSIATYNLAVRELCEAMELQKPRLFASDLKELGVQFDSPKVGLPLRHVQVAAPLPASSGSQVGVPMVVVYETEGAPLYPPEGLSIDATAIYDRIHGQPRFTILSNRSDVLLNGRIYPLASNHNAAGDYLKLRAKRFAASGFAGMIRPFSALRKPQIYLLDPYDPNKIPLVMVHGLQSTPVGFAALVNALRSDPEIRTKYQIWQFYYASGTPVLLNALELRDSLNETLHILDPRNHNAATKRIVVLGHSMGGVISHTLVSSSRDLLWRSVFRVPPARLKGDPDVIRELERSLIFRRDPRVVRVVFMAAPHRGSPLADSFVGFVGNSITRLEPMSERGYSQLANENPEAMTSEAAIFYRGRFSAVRTLSPRDSALIALSKLPIEVPYHSVIGQHYSGPKERGSDGVVPYWSSHLDGAESELIVRSGHEVFAKPEAVREIIRILHLEESVSKGSTWRRSAAGTKDETKLVPIEPLFPLASAPNRGSRVRSQVDEFLKTVRPTCIIKRFILPQEDESPSDREITGGEPANCRHGIPNAR